MRDPWLERCLQKLESGKLKKLATVCMWSAWAIGTVIYMIAMIFSGAKSREEIEKEFY